MSRTTRELVVLMLVVTLSVVLVVIVAGVVLLEVVDPSADTSRAAGVVGSTLSALTGIVLGYLVRGHRESE